MTQTKHENEQTMETKDTCFRKGSFIDRSFLVLKILRGQFALPPTAPPWLRKPKKPMVTRAKHFDISLTPHYHFHTLYR